MINVGLGTLLYFLKGWCWLILKYSHFSKFNSFTISKDCYTTINFIPNDDANNLYSPISKAYPSDDYGSLDFTRSFVGEYKFNPNHFDIPQISLIYLIPNKFHLLFGMKKMIDVIILLILTILLMVIIFSWSCNYVMAYDSIFSLKQDIKVMVVVVRN